MQTVCRTIASFKANSKAVTALEYAMITALIAVAAVTVISGLGTQLSTTFANVTSAL